MTIPLDQWIKAKNFKNQDAFARELCKKKLGVFTKTREAERHRRLGNQLSRLKQGQTTWWNRNLEVAQAAAELLGVTVDRLLGADRNSEAEELIAFPEFPALRPLNVLEEPPMKEAGELQFVGEPGLSESSRNLFRLPYSGLSWIQAPPGAGKSLALRYEQIRTEQKDRAVPDGVFLQTVGSKPRPGPQLFLQARRLADVILDGPTPSWLIVDLAQQDPASDGESMRALTRYRHVVVLAPFPRPGRGEAPPFKSLTKEQQNQERESRWQDYLWNPGTRWREAFIEWVAGRLGTERKALEPQEFIHWLRELDGDGRLIQTPGELLMLCALAYEQGTRRLRKRFADGWRDISREWITEEFRREARDDTGGAAWLRANGAEAVRALASAAWRSDKPWPPRESMLTWAHWLPERFHAPPAEHRIDAMLDAIVQEKSLKVRAQKARQLKAPLKNLSPTMAIDYLASTRLFRASGGGLALHPRWMADALAREFVEHALLQAPASWGVWAARTDRRHVVEFVLEAAKFSQLVSLADRAVKEFDPSSLGSVGVIETLFAQVGRRVRETQVTDRETTVLHELCRCHLGSLVERYGNSLPVPVTRPGVSEGSMAWIADCWAWSFSLSPPAWEVPEALRWCFPGWTRPLLGDATAEKVLGLLYPRTRSGFQPVPVTPEEEPEFFRLLRWTDNLADVCLREPLPPRLPAVILPAALLWAARRGVQVEPAQLQGLLHHEWQTLYLVGRIDAMPEAEVRTRLCDTLWQAMVRGSSGILGVLGGRSSKVEERLLERVTSHVSPEMVRRSLREEGLGSGRAIVEGVSPRLLRVVVEAAAETASDRLFEIDVSALGSEYVEVFEFLAVYPQARGSACTALWRVAPERALSLCRTLLQQSDAPDAALGLFWHAPPEEQDSLLGILEEKATTNAVLPEWVTRWLARSVFSGGPIMERSWGLRARLVGPRGAAPAGSRG